MSNDVEALRILVGNDRTSASRSILYDVRYLPSPYRERGLSRGRADDGDFGYADRASNRRRRSR